MRKHKGLEQVDVVRSGGIGLKDGRERERGEEEEDKEVFEGLSRVVGPTKKARLDLHDNPS